MGYLLAVLRALITGVRTTFEKNYITNTKEVKFGLDIYMIIIYPIATFFYFLMSGCNVSLNLPTLAFSVVFALISISSNVCGMVGLNFATIVYLNVFSSAGGTVMVFIYELLFTDATFSMWSVLAVILRVFAVSIPLLFTKGEKSMTKKGFLICIIYFVIQGMAGIVSRMYVNNPHVMSTSSFFFWTNVFIMLIVFADIFRKNDIKALVSDAKKIGLKNYFYPLLNAIVGNVAVIVSFEIVRLLGGTISSIITGSLGMITTVFVSTVIYKEGMSKQSAISILLSIAAVILSVF